MAWLSQSLRLLTHCQILGYSQRECFWPSWSPKQSWKDTVGGSCLLKMRVLKPTSVSRYRFFSYWIYWLYSHTHIEHPPYLSRKHLSQCCTVSQSSTVRHTNKITQTSTQSVLTLHTSDKMQTQHHIFSLLRVTVNRNIVPQWVFQIKLHIHRSPCLGCNRSQMEISNHFLIRNGYGYGFIKFRHRKYSVWLK